MSRENVTKAKDSSKLPAGLLLNNGMPTTNATRLPSVVNKKRDVSLQSNRSKAAVSCLFKQEFKPKIKQRATSKKDRDEFFAEEDRRRKHEFIKESARKSVFKKEDDKKKKEEERKKARLAGSSIKSQDIITFGFGKNKNIPFSGKGSLTNGRISVKSEIDDDDISTFNRRITSASRRITDDDDIKKSVLSKLHMDDFIRGEHKEVFSSSGPVKLPLVSWTVHRKRRRKTVVAKTAGKLGKKFGTKSFRSAGKTVDDDLKSPNPTWKELKKLGIFDSTDPLKPFINPFSSGLYLSTPRKDQAKITLMNAKSSMATALLKQFLHPARSDIVLIKVPPLPVANISRVNPSDPVQEKSHSAPALTFCSFLQRWNETGGTVGKLQVCKSGRAFLVINNMKLELGFASNTGNIIDLVKLDMDKLKTLEVDSSRDIMGNADCLGNAGFQMVLAPQWDSLNTS